MLRPPFPPESLVSPAKTIPEASFEKCLAFRARALQWLGAEMCYSGTLIRYPIVLKQVSDLLMAHEMDLMALEDAHRGFQYGVPEVMSNPKTTVDRVVPAADPKTGRRPVVEVGNFTTTTLFQHALYPCEG